MPLDFDECLKGCHLCRKDQTCNNLFGEYSCICKNGFEIPFVTICLQVWILILLAFCSLVLLFCILTAILIMKTKRKMQYVRQTLAQTQKIRNWNQKKKTNKRKAKRASKHFKLKGNYCFSETIAEE